MEEENLSRGVNTSTVEQLVFHQHKHILRALYICKFKRTEGNRWQRYSHPPNFASTFWSLTLSFLTGRGSGGAISYISNGHENEQNWMNAWVICTLRATFLILIFFFLKERNCAELCCRQASYLLRGAPNKSKSNLIDETNEDTYRFGGWNKSHWGGNAIIWIDDFGPFCGSLGGWRWAICPGAIR